MDKVLPRQLDTVIVGSGPAALILSYILHGNIPRYNTNAPHPDSLLHDRVRGSGDLLNVDVDVLTQHFTASRFSYSTQALPVNVLLDTLIRPLGETNDAEQASCVQWRFDPQRAVQHAVIGSTDHAGGQWVDNPVKASWDIGTLSYAEMLSLPGYSFNEFYESRHGRPLPTYLRPSRREVTEYFARYPHETGIADTFFPNTSLSGIRRDDRGFWIGSHHVACRHLVLASGIFTTLIQPPAFMRPLLGLPCIDSTPSTDPILVVGSGFSAADIVISTPSSKSIIHIYKWLPSQSPSPLRACHADAYPEYAGVYRKMKLAAIGSAKSRHGRPENRRRQSSAFDQSRDWSATYEGLPNTTIIGIRMEGRRAVVTLQREDNVVLERLISGFAYAVGRRGSLDYLDPELRHEVCPAYDAVKGLSGADMRDQTNENLEVADNVFVIGSLTGDTLIRFAYGGCTYAASKIMNSTGCALTPRRSPRLQDHHKLDGRSDGHHGSPHIKTMSGLDGHQTPTKTQWEEISLDNLSVHTS